MELADGRMNISFSFTPDHNIGIGVPCSGRAYFLRAELRYQVTDGFPSTPSRADTTRPGVFKSNLALASSK
jgi:hypothetical protein